MIRSRKWGAVLLVTTGAVACSAQETVGASSQALTMSEVRLTPSNLPADICDTPGTKDLIDATGTIDTDTGCDAVVVQGGVEPDICVYKYRTVALSGGGLRGVGSMALAIVATDTMTIGAFVDVGAHGTVKGPGASSSHGFPDWGVADAPGASHGALGGLGALGWATPGPEFGNETAVPLQAGSMGGPGYAGFGDHNPSLPGEGGGALQLVSCTALVVTSTGVISSGGGGAGNTVRHGAGGGSGGTILLEAPTVVIDGILGANGGGGGGAQCPDFVEGGDGGDGGPTQGGWGGVAAYGPPGGMGGSNESAPGRGLQSRPSSGCANSGGGGGVGRIRINVQEGTQPSLSGARSLSPAPSIGAIATH